MPAIAISRRAMYVVLALAAAFCAANASIDGPWSNARQAIADEPDGSSQTTGIRIRLAEARVRLAEYTLERAVEANRVVPGSVGPREIDRLQRNLGLTRRQLEIVRGHPRTTVRETNLAAAETGLAIARGDLEAALRANDRHRDSVSDINVKRLRSRLELAELQLELLRNPGYAPSVIDEMQWHIDQLTDQVIELQHRLGTKGDGDFESRQ